MDAGPKAKNQQQPSAALPNVPSSWPGSFGIYKYSKQAVLRNVWVVVSLYALSFVVTIILETILKQSFLGGLVGDIISFVVSTAIVVVLIDSVNGQKVTLSDAINKSWPFVLKYVVLSLLVGFSLMGAFLLLVVPFFFVLPRLILAPYYLIDKNMGIMDAYKASWNNTKGYSALVWGVVGVSILMSLLMITIIGIPFSLYFLLMYSAAPVLVYAYVDKHPVVSSNAPIPTSVS